MSEFENSEFENPEDISKQLKRQRREWERERFQLVNEARDLARDMLQYLLVCQAAQPELSSEGQTELMRSTQGLPTEEERQKAWDEMIRKTTADRHEIPAKYAEDFRERTETMFRRLKRAGAFHRSDRKVPAPNDPIEFAVLLLELRRFADRLEVRTLTGIPAQ